MAESLNRGFYNPIREQFEFEEKSIIVCNQWRALQSDLRRLPGVHNIPKLMRGYEGKTVSDEYIGADMQIIFWDKPYEKGFNFQYDNIENEIFDEDGEVKYYMFIKENYQIDFDTLGKNIVGGRYTSKLEAYEDKEEGIKELKLPEPEGVKKNQISSFITDMSFRDLLDHAEYMFEEIDSGRLESLSRKLAVLQNTIHREFDLELNDDRTDY